MAIADNMPNDRPQDLMRRISDLERQVRELRSALNLRDGSVSNDALAAPVVQSVARNRVTGFGLGNSAYVELAGVDIVVPEGCTQVQATVNASIFAYNPNTTGGSDAAGGDAWHIIASLGGQSTDDEVNGVSGNGGYAPVRTADSFNITGLTPGQTLRLSVYGASAYAAVAANSNNNAKVSAGLSFLR